MGWLKPGDRMTLTFSVPEEVVHRAIGEIPYKLRVRGANFVAIEPRGEAYPLYENQPTGKLIRKPRFLPQISQIIW